MLQADAYEEVERDRDATLQALLVVLVVTIASAIGGGLAAGVGGIILGAILAVVSWFLFAGIAYWVGTTFLAERRTRTTWGELLRTTGFAQAPGVLRVLSFVPILGFLISLAVSIWVFIAVVVAVRQALDFDTTRAIVTCLVAWIIQLVLTFILFAILV
jgi:hypothetical protein